MLDPGAVPGRSTKDVVVMPYKDRSVQRQYQRDRVAQRRLKYIDLHGGKCVRCGGDDRLEFDHVDRNSKVDHRIWSWSERRVEDELSKCQLLCRPCHTEKSVEEMGYPERQHGTNLMYQKERCRCDACRAAHAEVNAAYR